MALGEAQAGATVDPWASQITRSSTVSRCPDWPRQQPASSGVRTRWMAPGHRQCRQQGHFVTPHRPRTTPSPQVIPDQLPSTLRRYALGDVVPDGRGLATANERGAQPSAPQSPLQPGGRLYPGACRRVLGLAESVNITCLPSPDRASKTRTWYVPPLAGYRSSPADPTYCWASADARSGQLIGQRSI